MTRRELSREQPTSEYVLPTQERAKRDDGIEILPNAIADEYGDASQPYRAVDVLAGLEHRGVIDAEMYLAALDFRAAFQRAHLDPLRAADMSRAIGNGSELEPPIRVERARDSVNKALIYVGGREGRSSILGSCLWYVIGCQYTIKQWCFEKNWRNRCALSQHEARGVLRSALDMLVDHYRIGRDHRRPQNVVDKR